MGNSTILWPALFVLLLLGTAAGYAWSSSSTPALGPDASPTSETTPPPKPTLAVSASPNPNPYIVISQLNLWYYGPGCYGGFEAFDCSGKRTTSLTPYLGSTYVSADPAVIRQQIEWAVEYGVDAFSLEWTTPRGIPGSLEVNIDDAFLKATNLYKIRWCIFYDFNLRLSQTPGLSVDISRGIDFGDHQVSDTFVSDFAHFAKKYFNNPQYLSIDGRPVVYIWATWNFKGDYAATVKTARDAAAARGYDVFILCDEIRADIFDKGRASVWDAITAFTFLVAGTPQPWPWANVGDAAIALDQVYQKWQETIQRLKVMGRNDFVNFQPGWTPQFDNRLGDLYNDNGRNTIYVPAENKEQVTAIAEVARKYAEPVGSRGWRLIWENTWNCWQETTTIEPTANSGAKYPAGNYQFDMLEVVREVFGPETFSEPNVATTTSAGTQLVTTTPVTSASLVSMTSATETQTPIAQTWLQMNWEYIAIVTVVVGIAVIVATRTKAKEPVTPPQKEAVPPKQKLPTEQFCISCGTKLPANSKFCNNCGFKQP